MSKYASRNDDDSRGNLHQNYLGLSFYLNRLLVIFSKKFGEVMKISSRELFTSLVLILLTANSHGSDCLRISSGGSLTLSSNGAMNISCHDLYIGNGGSLGLSDDTSTIQNIRNVTLENGASITGNGSMRLAGTWANIGDFTKTSTLTVEFFSGCSVENACSGSGDTDSDGHTDRQEGMKDKNNDGIPDFLDPAIQSCICDINNDNLNNLSDIVLGLQLVAGCAISEIDSAADINDDGLIGMEEVLCNFMLMIIY